MDTKTPLLPTYTASTPEVCCRHQRLSRWAIAISIIALINVCFHNHRSRYISVEPHVASESSPAVYDLQSQAGINIGTCHEMTDAWESSEYLFTAPKETYSGVQFEEKGFRHLSLKGGDVNVVVDDQVKETTIRVEAKYNDPEIYDYLDVYTEELDDGVLHIIFNAHDAVLRGHQCLQVNVVVTLPDPSSLNTLSIGVSNNAITLADAGLLFSESLSLSTANGRIETNGVSGGDISLTTANGRIDGDITTFSGETLTATSSNGHTAVDVTTITSPANIRVHTSNGAVSASLPDSFETDFQVSTVFGRVDVNSPYPDKIHYNGFKSTNHKSGYYGNPDEKTGSSLTISTVNGKAALTFVK